MRTENRSIRPLCSGLAHGKLHRQANPPLLLPRLPSWRVPVNSVKGLPRQSGLLVISSQLSKISNPGSHY